MPKFEYRVSQDEALGWQLYKKTLNWELIDRAELAARDQYGPDFINLEVDTNVALDGDDFVVTFEWGEDDLPAKRRVRVSFDVLTRRAGTAELDVPTGTNVEALLNEHLDTYGTELVTEHLPEGVTVHEWNVEERCEHKLETDWVEDVEPTEANA